jgi:hypothetical protein
MRPGFQQDYLVLPVNIVLVAPVDPHVLYHHPVQTDARTLDAVHCSPFSRLLAFPQLRQASPHLLAGLNATHCSRRSFRARIKRRR